MDMKEKLGEASGQEPRGMAVKIHMPDTAGFVNARYKLTV